MAGRHIYSTNLFTKAFGHPILPFHYIIRQEELCIKDGIPMFDNVMISVISIKISNSIRNSRKSKFKYY